MKVLLVSINSQYIHSSPVPYILKAACRELISAPESELTIEVSEFTINDRRDWILGQIILRNPDVLAVSCYIWNFELVCRIIPDIKKILPNLKVVLGGPEAENAPKPAFCDEVVFGDGELSFPAYLSKQIPIPLARTKEPSGFTSRDLRLDAARAICEAGKGKIVYLETVRGCPFKCSYCLAPQCGKVRNLEMSLVRELIDIYMNSQVKQIKFVDRTCNADKARFLEIISYIFEQNSRGTDVGGEPIVNWHFEVAADLFSEEFFELAARLPVGLMQFEVGVQSLNEAVLAGAARVTDVEKVLENVERIVALETCVVHADLIAGLPGEDFASFVLGFNRLHSALPQQLQLGFLKVLRGSRLAVEAEGQGLVWSDCSPFQVLSTREMTWRQLHELALVEELVERCWNNGRFVETVKALAGDDFFGFYYALAKHMTSDFENESQLALPISAARMALALYEFASDGDSDGDGVYEGREGGAKAQMPRAQMPQAKIPQALERTSALRKVILTDLLLSCYPVKIPSELKVSAPSKLAFVEVARAARVHFGDAKIHFDFVTPDEILVINCDEKSPVSGRFKYFFLSAKNL